MNTTWKVLAVAAFLGTQLAVWLSLQDLTHAVERSASAPVEPTNPALAAWLSGVPQAWQTAAAPVSDAPSTAPDCAAKEPDEPPANSRDEGLEDEPSAGYQAVAAAVDDAMRVGRWTEKDRDTLRQRMASLNPKEREEIMRSIVVAINEGEMEAALEGAPL